jgi:NAD(P)-dependent dehydrogenase (short-subunit alcohol dehydrogenase family)
MLLQDKVAVVYGAGGEIGGAVARAFAGEGARVFLTGRLQAPGAKASGTTWEQFTGYFASTTHARRVMALQEVADMAVFMASDRASGMTGTTVNLSMGSLGD